MSATFARAIRDEVARIAKRELKTQITAVKSHTATLRRDNAELKRQVKELQRKVKLLEKQESRRVQGSQENAPRELAEGARFSPSWVKAHRKKLGFSAEDYAKLVGVHKLTIYKWEKGESKPRQEQFALWVAIRGLGKREAIQRLALLGEDVSELPRRRGRPRKSKD